MPNVVVVFNLFVLWAIFVQIAQTEIAELLLPTLFGLTRPIYPVDVILARILAEFRRMGNFQIFVPAVVGLCDLVGIRPIGVHI